MFYRKALYGAILALACSGALATDIPIVDVGNEASGFTVDPVIGKAFVTNYADGTLSAIDTRDYTVSTIDAGQNPRRALADAATHTLYFLNDTSPGYVTVFDAHFNVPVARVMVGDSPRNLAADFPRAELYVSNHDSDSLSIVDTSVNKLIANVAVGHEPGAVDVDRRAGRIYVASADGLLSIIDQKTRTLVATVAVGNNPGSVAADERTAKVYVNNVDDGTVSVIDGMAGTVIATLPAGAGSTLGTLSALYHRYYLPNSADGTVSIVDTDADVVLRTVSVGDAPQQVVVDGASARMYVINKRDSEIAILDVEGVAFTGRSPAGPNPSRLLAGAGQLLVLNEKDGAPDAVTVVEQPRIADPTSIVTEYSAPGTGDYFHTAGTIENRVLADGLFGDAWRRTMQFWRVWDAPGAGRSAMCRFASSDLQATATHFYTALGDECDALKQDPLWTYEGDAYYVALPDAAGNCGDGTVALYRLYNDSTGAPFHRYTIDPGIKAGMQAAGWKVEGGGVDAVFACVPALSGSALAVAPALIADGGELVDANPAVVRRVVLPIRPSLMLRQP